MALSGDLSTLELADLLQNLETHARTGVLVIEVHEEECRLYFEEGRLSLIAREGHMPLVDVLVASGAIGADALETARKKRRRSRRSLSEVLVALGAVDEETLRSIAEARLIDEACELVAAGAGAFTFTEGPIPRGVFDPEERRLGLNLPAGPLLLESARREDHWRLIRELIPSDAIHLVVTRAPRGGGDEPVPELLAPILAALDGSVSVGELMARFPHRRFEAMNLLSGLVGKRVVREVTPAELLQRAQALEGSDPEHARRLVRRGLQANPRDLELLAARARMAEDVGELEEAAEALKLQVHLLFEMERPEDARSGLARLEKLAPRDPAVWERSFELALAEERADDAIVAGRELASCYLEPGLFGKAAEVHARLAELDPSSWDLASELAHSRAKAGDLAGAVRGLLRFGEDHLARGEDKVAVRAYEEVLALEPANVRAKRSLDLIRSGALARRRESRRRWRNRCIGTLVAAAGCYALGYEGLARLGYARAVATIAADELIEERRYAEAAAHLAEVRARLPWAPTAWLDVRVQVADLLRKELGDGAPDAAADAPTDG
jgi:tetratricopeptide (TPR) repeat protein